MINLPFSKRMKAHMWKHWHADLMIYLIFMGAVAGLMFGNILDNGLQLILWRHPLMYGIMLVLNLAGLAFTLFAMRMGARMLMPVLRELDKLDNERRKLQHDRKHQSTKN